MAADGSHNAAADGHAAGIAAASRGQPVAAAADTGASIFGRIRGVGADGSHNAAADGHAAGIAAIVIAIAAADTGAAIAAAGGDDGAAGDGYVAALSRGKRRAYRQT